MTIKSEKFSNLLNQWSDDFYSNGPAYSSLACYIDAKIQEARKEERKKLEQAITALRDSHKKATNECESDCDFVTAWNDCIELVRSLPEEE